MNLKSLVLGIALFFSGTGAIVFAQDIITLRSGDEIKAVVSEVDINTIRYKKFENPTGPIYTLTKADVFMIKYENGTKEIFDLPANAKNNVNNGNSSNATQNGLAYRKPGAITENSELLSKDESRKILAKNPMALKTYNTGQKLIKTGSVLVGISLVTSFGFMLLVKNPSLSASMVALTISSSTLIGSITTTLTGRKKIKKAVNIYNSGIPK